MPNTIEIITNNESLGELGKLQLAIVRLFCVKVLAVKSIMEIMGLIRLWNYSIIWI